TAIRHRWWKPVSYPSLWLRIERARPHEDLRSREDSVLVGPALPRDWTVPEPAAAVAARQVRQTGHSTDRRTPDRKRAHRPRCYETGLRPRGSRRSPAYGLRRRSRISHEGRHAPLN